MIKILLLCTIFLLNFACLAASQEQVNDKWCIARLTKAAFIAGQNKLIFFGYPEDKRTKREQLRNGLACRRRITDKMKIYLDGSNDEGGLDFWLNREWPRQYTGNYLDY